MEFVYDRLVSAPLSSVWAALTDPEAMEPHLPGTAKVESTGAESYRVSMKISMGFLRPTVKANVQLVDVIEHSSFTIVLSGKSMGAGVSGEAKMTLSESEGDSNSTRIVMTGEVETTGLLKKVSDTKIENAATGFLESYLPSVEQGA